jgi:galactonate dehydratase
MSADIGMMGNVRAALRSLSVSVAKISDRTRWVFTHIANVDGGTGTGEATLVGSERAVVASAAKYASQLSSFAARDPGEFAAAAAPDTLADAAVVSSIDLALWDLHAQSLGIRLVDALGGAQRNDVPVYANVNRRTDDRSPEGFARSARDALNAGYRALKIAPFDEVSPTVCARGDGLAAMRTGLARVAAVREVAGAHVRLMVDCHWRFDEACAARMIAAAAEHHVHWVECPLPENEGNLDVLMRLRRHANARGILLAGMENGIGSESFRPFCEVGAYDVMMPDVKYVGGVREMLRCSELFARYRVAMSPHNPSGPVAHAASLHLSAAMGDFDMLELQFDESPLFDRLVDQLPQPQAGMSTLPNGPGLGVRLDVSTLAANMEAPPCVWEISR